MKLHKGNKTIKYIKGFNLVNAYHSRLKLNFNSVATIKYNYYGYAKIISATLQAFHLRLGAFLRT